MRRERRGEKEKIILLFESVQSVVAWSSPPPYYERKSFLHCAIVSSGDVTVCPQPSFMA